MGTPLIVPSPSTANLRVHLVSAFGSPRAAVVMQYDDGWSGGSGYGGDHDNEYAGRVGGGRSGRRGGGSYEREVGDTAPVDVAAVESLITERTDARRARDFNAADTIREQLRSEYRVEVFDRESTWRVGRSGGGRGGSNGGRGGSNGQRGEREPRTYDSLDLGEKGHDYERDGDTELLEIDEATSGLINKLLASRLEAKMGRDFDKADALKAQLSGLGVSVNDKRRTWEYSTPRDVGPYGHDYVRAEEDSTEFDEQALATINDLLRDRLAAKLEGRYDAADAYMEELSALGVFVNEKVRGWRADGKAFPTHQRIEGDGDGDEALMAALDEERVMEMLAERALLRKDGDYDAADAIVAQLRQVYSVVLDDKKGTWRVAVMSGGYYRVGPYVDAFTAKKVGDLLERRAAHQEAKEYDEADALHAEIDAMGISLDTRLRAWRVGRADKRDTRRR